jgi:hypothetical protein
MGFHYKCALTVASDCLCVLQDNLLSDYVATSTSLPTNDANTITVNFTVDQRTVSLTLNRNNNIPPDVPVYTIEDGVTTRWTSPALQVGL